MVELNPSISDEQQENTAEVPQEIEAFAVVEGNGEATI